MWNKVYWVLIALLVLGIAITLIYNTLYAQTSTMMTMLGQPHLIDNSIIKSLQAMFAGSNSQTIPLSGSGGDPPSNFIETGLPVGTTWQVTFNGNTQSTNGNILTIFNPAGNFTFSVPHETNTLTYNPFYLSNSPQTYTSQLNAGSNIIVPFYPLQITGGSKFPPSGPSTTPTCQPSSFANNYSAITLTNYQPFKLAANTPIFIGTSSANPAKIVGWNAVVAQKYETPNLNNIEFTDSACNILSSWLVGNMTSPQTANTAATLITSHNALANSNQIGWFLTSNWLSSFLPANTGTATQNVIFLWFLGNSLTTKNTVWSTTSNVGEAPQLACENPFKTGSSGCVAGYGRNDTAPGIFNISPTGKGGFYDNFISKLAATTLNTSKWNAVAGSSQTSTWQVNNGLVVTGAGAGGVNEGFTTTSNAFNANNLYLASEFETLSVSGGSPSSNLAETLSSTYGTSGFDDGISGGYAGTTTYQLTAWSKTGVNTGLTPTLTGSNPLLTGSTWAGSAGNSNGLDAGYEGSVGNIIAASKVPTALQSYYFGIEQSGGSFASSFSLPWIAGAIIPPNGIYPSETFGTITSYGASTTVNACSFGFGWICSP